MKSMRLVILLFGLINSITCFSQVYVDGVPIDTINTPFCQLICANGSVLTRTSVSIDYGQRYVNTGLNRQKISGPDRLTINFNSTIDALNFMVKQGWELVSFQVTGTESGSERTFVYMLQRKKKSKVTD